VLIPLTADLARPQRRATSIAIVLSGLLLGVLLARVLSGIIAQFSSFRNVYWMGVGGEPLSSSSD
jgi:predicted MFS family arabinose efflux permease